MCCLIAKVADGVGCVALWTVHGKHLSELKRRITSKIGYDRVQLVVLSRPSAYGEYSPYRFVSTEEEFEKLVVKM